MGVHDAGGHVAPVRLHHMRPLGCLQPVPYLADDAVAHQQVGILQRSLRSLGPQRGTPHQDGAGGVDRARRRRPGNLGGLIVLLRLVPVLVTLLLRVAGFLLLVLLVGFVAVPLLGVLVAPAVDPDLHHLGLLGEQVTVGDGEVGQLARSDGAQQVLYADQPRGSQGQRLQRRVRIQAAFHRLTDLAVDLVGTLQLVGGECERHAGLVQQVRGFGSAVPVLEARGGHVQCRALVTHFGRGGEIHREDHRQAGVAHPVHMPMLLTAAHQNGIQVELLHDACGAHQAQQVVAVHQGQPVPAHHVAQCRQGAVDLGPTPLRGGGAVG